MEYSCNQLESCHKYSPYNFKPSNTIYELYRNIYIPIERSLFSHTADISAEGEAEYKVKSD